VTKAEQITIRLEGETLARFDRVVAKLGGAATRAAMVRVAMLAGLPAIEERYKDLPDAPLTSPSTAKAPKRRRAAR
jgi:hypothetical protein